MESVHRGSAAALTVRRLITRRPGEAPGGSGSVVKARPYPSSKQPWEVGGRRVSGYEKGESRDGPKGQEPLWQRERERWKGLRTQGPPGGAGWWKVLLSRRCTHPGPGISHTALGKATSPHVITRQGQGEDEMEWRVCQCQHLVGAQDWPASSPGSEERDGPVSSLHLTHSVTVVCCNFPG